MEQYKIYRTKAIKMGKWKRFPVLITLLFKDLVAKQHKLPHGCDDMGSISGLHKVYAYVFGIVKK